MVDCQSRPGESGTGFVDRCGDLYVLKGPMIDGVEGANKLFKSRGLINEERESFTFVIGPVTLATKTTGAVQ